MRTRYAFTFLFALLFYLPQIKAQSRGYYTDSLSGIKIVWDEVSFPNKWLYSPINAFYAPIEEKERKRFIPILIKAMRKYPVYVLEKNLKCIYITGYLNFYGVRYGGTNSNECLYLANEGVQKGYTDFYLEQLFHHEFSSILLRNYGKWFDSKEWLNYTKHEFKEGTSGVDAIKNGTNKLDFDEELCQKGILYQYALSNLENDFNSYAENLFCPRKEFWKVVEQYPNVKQKLFLITEFYNQLHSQFNMDYFMKFKPNYFD